MASSPLAKKLKIKEDTQILIINPSQGYLNQLDPLPTGVEMKTEPQGQFDFAQLFVKNGAELEQYLPDALKSLHKDCLLWISFPKRSSKIQTDLSRDHGWEPVENAGFKGASLISINDTWSAMRFRGGLVSMDQELVAAQYSGKKAALQPIYEHLVKVAQGFGPDVELAPRKTYVGLQRGKMFAVIKASTATRVDLGMKLKDPVGDDRLVATPGFGSGSSTHKVALTGVEQIDKQVLQWLKEAYDGVG
jgi:hypothetical protein